MRCERRLTALTKSRASYYTDHAYRSERKRERNAKEAWVLE